MLSSESARPNCVIPAVLRASEADTRKMLALSLYKATGLPYLSRYARVDAK